MTRKQFEWIKGQKDRIEVNWFNIYKGKEPDKFHYPTINRITMEIDGEYFIFSGNYYIFNGRNLDEKYSKCKVHYKNVESISYRRKH